MKIAVAGTGYVGLSLALLLSAYYEVAAVDVVPQKIKMLQNGISPIDDEDISNCLRKQNDNFTATLDGENAYKHAEYVIIATPTDYDASKNFFDTSHVEQVVELVLDNNPDAVIVIKSTVPVGYTESLCAHYPEGRFLFSPEFLREGRALFDCLHPSRVIVGVPANSAHTDLLLEAARQFSSILVDCADPADDPIPTLIMGSTEAEASKLFANAFLALRVSFFNELDTYAALNGLDANDIISGVSHDPRIGDFYNNPSFGYGGYCLPKDTKQLLANYQGIPQNIIEAIVASNETRIAFIANQLIERARKIKALKGTWPTIGFYRLTMKEGSDNFRSSSVIGVINRLEDSNCSKIIYEPTLNQNDYLNIPVEKSLSRFLEESDIVVANRWNDELAVARAKVFTRDLFQRD